MLGLVALCTDCALLSDGGVCEIEMTLGTLSGSATAAASSSEREGGIGSGIEGQGKALCMISDKSV